MRVIYGVICVAVFCMLAINYSARAGDSCSGLMSPRLTVGEQGRVTPGDANLMRREPDRASTVVGRIPAGGVFTVVGGPVCGTEWYWWQVNYNGTLGWTAEGKNGVYWLEPLNSGNVFSPTKTPNANSISVKIYTFVPTSTPWPTHTPSPIPTATPTLKYTYTPRPTNTRNPFIKAPTLIEPTDGSTVDTLLPEFKYEFFAPGYYIEVARDSRFREDDILMRTGWDEETEHKIETIQFDWSLPGNTKVYWRVINDHAEKPGPSSEVWSFYTPSASLLPKAPFPLRPGKFSTLTCRNSEKGLMETCQVMFCWTGIVGVVEYELTVAMEGSGGSSYERTKSTCLRSVVIPNVKTTFYWWVRARNKYGWSQKSDEWEFTLR